MTDSSEPTRIAICIPTFHRPLGLARALRAIRNLDARRRSDLDISVWVFDNDPAASARSVCDRFRDLEISYVVEPERGVSAVRNRALASVCDSSDFVAFMDDDEAPVPTWLDALVDFQRATGADVVVGPVLPKFECVPAAWIVRGHFFDRPRLRSGTDLQHAATGNVLLDCNLLRRWSSIRFDERFALSGGEDTHFFMRLTMLASARMVWCDEAVVYEWNPESRMSERWLVRRAFRSGTTWGLCCRLLLPRRAGVLTATKAWVRLALGIATFVIDRPWLAHRRVKNLRELALSLGVLLGLGGYTFREYRSIHGS